MIVCGLSIGISKKELLNDYFVEEIGEIIYEYNKLHEYKKEDTKVEEVYCDDFF
jgi:predicted amidohydrolase